MGGSVWDLGGLKQQPFAEASEYRADMGMILLVLNSSTR